MSQQESQAIVHTGHPTPGTYFKVALILSAITAIEVGVFYITALGKGIIPVLAVLSIAKFDHKLFTTLFAAGLALAMTVVFALIALFQFFV